MTTSARSGTPGPTLCARAFDVDVSDDSLGVKLEDGRTLHVPLAWFPRLLAATSAQRGNWKLIGRGVGIHWPDIDEDVLVETLLGANGELLTYQDPGALDVPVKSDDASVAMTELDKIRNRISGGRAV
jgi:Protein of unknown function (DUF2442)